MLASASDLTPSPSVRLRLVVRVGASALPAFTPLYSQSLPGGTDPDPRFALANERTFWLGSAPPGHSSPAAHQAAAALAADRPLLAAGCAVVAAAVIAVVVLA